MVGWFFYVVLFFPVVLWLSCLHGCKWQQPLCSPAMQQTKIESSNIYMTVIFWERGGRPIKPLLVSSGRDERGSIEKENVGTGKKKKIQLGCCYFAAGSHVQFRFPCEVAGKLSFWKYLHGFNKRSEMKKRFSRHQHQVVHMEHLRSRSHHTSTWAALYCHKLYLIRLETSQSAAIISLCAVNSLDAHCTQTRV